MTTQEMTIALTEQYDCIGKLDAIKFLLSICDTINTKDCISAYKNAYPV